MKICQGWRAECHLNEKSEGLNHFSSCSGSLVSNNAILTAKHCLWITQLDLANGRPIAYKVRCGAEEQITILATPYVGDEQGAAYDNLIVRTPKPFLNAIPVLLPESNLEDLILVQSSQKCFASAFGFGRDIDTTGKEHRGFIVFPSQGRLDRDEFSLGDSLYLRPGDSGGGTYCERSGGDYVLVGLIREAPMDFKKPGAANFLLDPVLTWIRQIIK